MTARRHAYCSFCLEKTRHQLVNQNLLSRNDYICTRCNNHTLQCRVPGCSHMSRGALTAARATGEEEAPLLTWNDELCAEHGGVVYSFERLTLRLTDVDRFSDLFVRDTTNVARVVQYGGFAAAGAGLAAGILMTGGAAAPLAASLGAKGLLGTASTGVAIASLKGAALTSASLAAIGGSVATGTLIVSAVGAALGGAKGGALAGEYHADDSSFSVLRLNTSRSPARTIFVNGFLEGTSERFNEWSDAQLEMEPDQNLYGVTWSAKSRRDLTAYFGGGAGSQATLEFLKQVAKSGGKAAAGRMDLIAWVDRFTDLLKNPWHVSMLRAAKAGTQLAEAIARTDGKQYTLVGHSLGCRVIFYTLLALATKGPHEPKRIANVVLLGGAVGADGDQEWSNAVSAVSGLVINCYSRHDTVLAALYRTANAGLSRPAGLYPVAAAAPNLVNLDCSGLIKSHFDWKRRYVDVIQRIRANVSPEAARSH